MTYLRHTEKLLVFGSLQVVESLVALPGIEPGFED